jgi:hypothetical protein
VNGSPGLADPSPPPIPPVVVNEVLSHSDAPPPTDFIELFNPAPAAADIGGWFITDDFATPRKFRIPAGATVRAGGFALFTETDFNPQPGTPPCFAFSSRGDEAFVFSADAQGNLTGYAHGFKFGAADDGVSFGRYLDSAGGEQFVPQAALTPGAANAGPRVGPAVISEIMYHPPAFAGADDQGMFEYLEIQNASRSAVPLYDPACPTNTWRVRGGVEFDFPPQTILATGAVLLVVGFDPAVDLVSLSAFRAAYNLTTNVQVLGPWAGLLNNAGDWVKLEKPATPAADATLYVLADAVRYRPASLWPAAANGTGFSLQRRLASAYGNDPTNWCAAAPTPGTASPVAFPPPELTIEDSGVLSWPASDPEAVLQFTETLAAPAPWQDDPSPRVIESGRIKVRVSLAHHTRFYRLIWR